MKSAIAQRMLPIGLLSLAALMFLPSSMLAAANPQQQGERLSKKELKVLIATAKAPQDHLRIATYYRAQAGHYLAQQKERQAQEEDYDRNPQRYSTKWPTMGQHCRDWAYNYGQSAKKALAQAESHERMAREAAK